MTLTGDGTESIFEGNILIGWKVDKGLCYPCPFMCPKPCAYKNESVLICDRSCAQNRVHTRMRLC